MKPFSPLTLAALCLLVASCSGTTAAPPPPAAAIALTPAASASATADAKPDGDVTSFAERVVAARELLKKDGGALWGVRLDGIQWMGVKDKQMYLSAPPPDPTASAKQVSNAVWTAPLPSGMTVANTAVKWGGASWAMIELPLDGDLRDDARLLIHEGFHVVQPSFLPLRPGEMLAGKELLQGAEGRTWLRLELAALADALTATGPARGEAIEDALLFRARRYAVAQSSERTREIGLDLSEGLAEYTGWKLTGDDGHAFALSVRKRATVARSYVRWFPYVTGPGYAFLLDAVAGDGWRRDVHAQPNLQRLLAHAVGSALEGELGDQAPLSKEGDAAVRSRAEARGAKYELVAIRTEEDARGEQQRRAIAAAEKAFVTGPTLQIPIKGREIRFDPTDQMSLGDKGTVMRYLGWSDPAGAELDAPGGGLVSSTWDGVRLPLGDVAMSEGVLPAATKWSGPGWTLTLPAGWRVRREGPAWIVVRP